MAVETRRKTSMLDRKHENVPDVSYLQLLKLNKPDWILVVIGVFFSAVIGCLFPVISILFSEVLRVSMTIINVVVCSACGCRILTGVWSRRSSRDKGWSCSIGWWFCWHGCWCWCRLLHCCELTLSLVLL